MLITNSVTHFWTLQHQVGKLQIYSGNDYQENSLIFLPITLYQLIIIIQLLHLEECMVYRLEFNATVVFNK